MPATDRFHAAALADLTREFTAVFGESPCSTKRVHEFAWDDWKPQGDFMVSPSGKRKLKRESWERLKSRGKKGTPPKPADAAKPAESPKPPPAAEVPKPPPPESSHPAPPAESPPEMPTAAKAKQTRGGARVNLKPYQRPRPMAPGDLAVESAAKLPAAPPPPATTPAEKAHFDAAKKADEAKYGPRAAGILSRAAEAVRGFLTLGGLTGGAYLGGKIGALAGGPLGLALGTAIGGGIGALTGRAWAPLARKAYSLATQKGRARAVVRRGVRKVLPKAVGAMYGIPMAAVGAAQPVMQTAAGAALGGPLGAGMGTASGIATGIGIQNAAMNTAAKAAKGTRLALATSAVSRRKAKLKNQDRMFAESFADDGLPSNAAAILKARLRVAARKAGVTLPQIPDEVVAAALKLASQDSATGTAAEALAEVDRFGRGCGKKVTEFRAKPFKVPIDQPAKPGRLSWLGAMFAEVEAARV